MLFYAKSSLNAVKMHKLVSQAYYIINARDQPAFSKIVLQYPKSFVIVTPCCWVFHFPSSRCNGSGFLFHFEVADAVAVFDGPLGQVGLLVPVVGALPTNWHCCTAWIFFHFIVLAPHSSGSEDNLTNSMDISKNIHNRNKSL